jgi:hypothetical protein
MVNHMFKEMTNHMFLGNGKSHVLWKWQITCSAEMVNPMFQGKGGSHVPRKMFHGNGKSQVRRKFWITCSAGMVNHMFRGNDKSHVPQKWYHTFHGNGETQFRGNVTSHVPRKWRIARSAEIILRLFIYVYLTVIVKTILWEIRKWWYIHILILYVCIYSVGSSDYVASKKWT